MKRKVLFFCSALLFGLAIGLLIAVRLDVFSPLQSQGVKREGSALEGLSMEEAIINVAGTTGKAVVSISAEQTVSTQDGRRYYFNYPFGGGRSQSEEEEFFRRFFEDFFGGMPNKIPPSLASGVIIDSEGYILTNEHVVGNADKIKVTLPDGREFKGEIKGKDQRSDLAVIKINAGNLPMAKLGDSDNVKIGQWVVAIGNPFAIALRNPEPTVTVGVISALHRSLGRGLGRNRDYNDLIQTDAAINPGNSGGPLVNLKGEIVGINVAIFTTSGGYQGVGFAIPVNNAKRIISQLIEGKKVLYGWIGVSVQNLTDDLAKHFDRPDKKGVLVAKVLKDGPAEKAGMKDADIINKFNNQSVDDVRGLLNVVGRTEVGRKVKVSVVRDNKEFTLEIEVGERPENMEELSAADGAVAQGWRGLKVEEITPETRQRFRIEEQQGLVVVNIDANSQADEAGLMVGDVILAINKRPIKNIADYEGVTREAKGDCLVKTARGYFLIKAQ